jgi:hypothetical protein
MLLPTTYLIAMLTILSFQGGGHTRQPSQPRTVVDYYLLLPDKYFEVDREQRTKWMLDQKWGAIVDVRNGYIHARGDGAQTSLYVRLFRKAGGGYLIAVKSYASDSQDYTYLDFYVYENRMLTNVTKRVFPIPANDELKYELPRYGRTIKVSTQNGRRVFDLLWTGSRFRSND